MFKRIRNRISFWRWYLLEFRPIAGADGSTDPDPAKPDPDPAKPDPDPAKPDPAPSPPAGKKLVDESELNRLQRIASEKDEADRKRKREEDEAAGKHAEVVQTVESEREAEKTKREEVEAELEGERKAATVAAVAGRLKFNDPADALAFLPADTPNDEASIEKALKKVAEEKAYLVGGQGSRTAAPGGGGDPAPPNDIDAQIAQAEKDGDVALSTRLKRQKHFSASK